MALALEAYGAPGYEVRAYETRRALCAMPPRRSRTNSPVILLAWRGAHTWVMTGFRADADPRSSRTPRSSGAYILDPWYPGISSIWGPSDPPGTFQNNAEMVRNFLPWKRPEGTVPGRATACTSRSCRRSRSARRADADAPDPRRQEDREQDVLGDHPGRVAERDAEDPELPARAAGGDDDDRPGRRTRR